MTHSPAISSRTNERVKRIARLHDRASRIETCLCWAESRACAQAALASSWRVDELALSTEARGDTAPLVEAARRRGCPVFMYDPACFAKFSALRHPDGVGAVVALPEPAHLPEAATERAVVLWQLQDPGNMGSIIRSASALGCRTIVTVGPCVDAFHPLSIRATAGQIFTATICACGEAEARAWLGRRAAHAAVLTADGSVRLDECPAGRVLVLVVGGEARGVPAEVRLQLASLAIPMEPGVESLNVNAAAAIALYTLWGAPPPYAGPASAQRSH